MAFTLKMRKEIIRNIITRSITEIHDQSNKQEYSVFPDFYNIYIFAMGQVA